MVKVEFTAWKEGENIHEWIPLLRPYAGKSYGCYWVPEVGDIVLVGFIGAGFCSPFVLGSFSPASAAADSGAFDKKNNVKRVLTRGGVEIALGDEKDKQSVEVKTPGGMAVALSDETQTVKLRDKNGKNVVSVDAKSGEITLTAEKKLTLACGSCKIEMTGSGGGLTISCGQLKLEAKQTAAVKGGQSLTLEGAMLKAEGKQMLGLKGGTLAQLEGAIVKIN